MSTGRRKEATARVQLYKGTGLIQVNKRGLAQYFGRPTLQMIVKQPLEAMSLSDKVNVIANVRGGGLAGQAGAVRHCAPHFSFDFRVRRRGCRPLETGTAVEQGQIGD